MKNLMIPAVKKITLLTLLACALTSCYRMPTEDDCSTIPMVNNRDITREKGGFTPSVSY